MTLYQVVPQRQPQPFDSLAPGDHVRVWRGFYWHHAIYVGNGQLIEFGQGILGGPVGYVSWSHFAKGQHVEVVRHSLTYSPDQIISNAKSQLGRNHFSLARANCEHFATWCATGRWESEQVRIVTRAVKEAAAAAIVIAALVVVVNHADRALA